MTEQSQVAAADASLSPTGLPPGAASSPASLAAATPAALPTGAASSPAPLPAATPAALPTGAVSSPVRASASPANAPVTLPTVIVVAGSAGSGKTTLGRALAARLGLPVLDLDPLTNPLLDALTPVLPGSHWLSGPHAALVRDGRYAALRATAADNVSLGQGAVLIAPFTAELRGGAEWELLVAALAGATVHVIHVDGSPALLAARRAARNAPRDAHRPPDPAPPASASPTPAAETDTFAGPSRPEVSVSPERTAAAVAESGSDTSTTTPATSRTPDGAAGSAGGRAAVSHLRVEAALSTTQQVQRVLREIGVRSAVDADDPLFSFTFDAVLFDLDGTLLDSTGAVLRSWDTLANEYGFSPSAVQENHGKPAGALIRSVVAPESVEAAAARIVELEVSDVDGVVPIAGALDLLASLPDGAKAVVTSGTRAIATARMAAAGIPAPRVVVTADDVVNAKPDPEPFLRAAAELGVDPVRCLVVEDAPAGVAAARAAGCRVLGVGGTTAADELGADLWVDALDRVAIRPAPAAPAASAAPGGSFTLIPR